MPNSIIILLHLEFIVLPLKLIGYYWLPLILKVNIFLINSAYVLFHIIALIDNYRTLKNFFLYPNAQCNVWEHLGSP